MDESREYGQLLNWNREKRYGFIKPLLRKSGKPHFFLHGNELSVVEDRQRIAAGQTIEFSPSSGERGPFARNAVIIE